jgi:hypothetical protein
MDTAASTSEVVQWLIVQLAAFQAALLIASGLHKLIEADRIQGAVREFAAVPSRFAPTAVVAMAAVELLAASLLCTPSFRAAGAALAILTWGGYLVLILRAIAQGRRTVDCGCSFGRAQRPLGAYQVVRNAALTGAALLVAAGAAAGATGWVSGSQILAAFALLALYFALDQVMALLPPRAGELL